MSSTLPSGFDFIEGVPEESYPDWLNCWLTALAIPANTDPSIVDFYRRTHPPERALAIRDDHGYVATDISLDCDMVLPGSRTVPVAFCTGGFCHPTHTRRGLMTVMLDRMTERAADEGKALCAGTPSEWPIYERFGHGPATWAESVEIDVRRAGLRKDAPGLTVRPRRVAGKEARDVAGQVFALQAATTPGEVIPPDAFWDRLSADPASSAIEQSLWMCGKGLGPRQCAAIDGRGFVSYRITPAWTAEHAASSTLQIIDFLAADTEAAGALWRHLFSIDMVDTIRADRLPVDDPLRWWVTDARRIRRLRTDGLWLRLIDVPRLLETRTWSADGAVTLQVHDRGGFTEGTYRLDVEAGAGSCRRTTATPDLVMDTSTLAAIILGGTPATSLHRSGRIEARDARHAQRWDALAVPERAPFQSYWL
ncbi:GNAT family N-acetyltransferase [Streptomyces sp. NPDC053429]|uniref:GNAT family N-acetyltransferase n=1 Tax=Streptomyces sp. NPDC053429 TaxID=3365702 RepID=UPI0037D0F790